VTLVGVKPTTSLLRTYGQAQGTTVQWRATSSLEAEHATTTLEDPKLLKIRTTYPREVLLAEGDITGSAVRAEKEKEPEGEFRKAP
jgi:hypothetical protein